MSRFLSRFFGLLVIALPLVTAKGIGTGAFARQEPLFWALIVCCTLLAARALFLISVCGRQKGVSALRLTVADLLAAAYLAAGLLNIVFIKDFAVDPVLLWRWAAVAAVYILVRTLGEGRRIILIALVVAGVVQAAVAVGQQAGWLSSNHRMFDVTGTFGNPGQLGGFLAVCLVAAVALVAAFIGKSDRKMRLFTGLSLVSALLILAGLWLADSRAAFVAAAAGLAILFWPQIAGALRRYAKWMIPAGVVAVAAAALLIFNHRPDSANARLLVWRVSADMVAEKPLFGHGAGSFNQKYMLYQAGYFEAHPDSRFAMVADNVAYPYNEFLHLLIEQGIAGLLILLALLWAVFARHSDNRRQQGFKAALAALLAFSCFSYPSYVFALLFLFPLLLGGLESRPVFSRQLPRWTWGAAAAIFLTIGIFGAREMVFYKEASQQMKALFSKESADAQDFTDHNYDKLKYNRYFYMRYASRLAENHNETKRLTRMFDLPPTCETYCDIGAALTERGAYDQAECYYRKAAAMIPTRLTPNYLLWKMYIEKGDESNAIETARKLLSQPLKVENTFTIRAKAEVRKYLNER